MSNRTYQGGMNNSSNKTGDLFKYRDFDLDIQFVGYMSLLQAPKIGQKIAQNSKLQKLSNMAENF